MVDVAGDRTLNTLTAWHQAVVWHFAFAPAMHAWETLTEMPETVRARIAEITKAHLFQKRNTENKI